LTGVRIASGPFDDDVLVLTMGLGGENETTAQKYTITKEKLNSKLRERGLISSDRSHAGKSPDSSVGSSWALEDLRVSEVASLVADLVSPDRYELERGSDMTQGRVIREEGYWRSPLGEENSQVSESAAKIYGIKRDMTQEEKWLILNQMSACALAAKASE